MMTRSELMTNIILMNDFYQHDRPKLYLKAADYATLWNLYNHQLKELGIEQNERYEPDES